MGAGALVALAKAGKHGGGGAQVKGLTQCGSGGAAAGWGGGQRVGQEKLVCQAVVFPKGPWAPMRGGW